MLGAAFAVLFLIGSLTSSANTPDYTAADQAWTNWAHDNQSKSRVCAFALLLAAFVFLYFIAGMRSVLERAESQVLGSAQLARLAFAGVLTGVVGMSMAFVTIANASAEGANANPARSSNTSPGSTTSASTPRSATSRPPSSNPYP
jgi:succinate dehydrogenase/fumarate reductase cytochrome b subunit